jgi:glycosyltransferase involved in cell wall biosynthesis
VKILNVIQCTNLGGMEQSNLLACKGLLARGHGIEAVSLTPVGEMAPLMREAGIPTTGIRYRGRGGWRSIPEMVQQFQGCAADALIMRGHNLAATLALMRNPAKRKVLAIHYHHFENDGGGTWRWEAVYRVAEWVFDHITFSSSFIRDEALSIRPQLERRSSVLPNPFDVPERPSVDERLLAKRRLGLGGSELVVGNAGWLIARKRFDVFLEVAAQVLKVRQDATFVIAGNGPDRENLQALAESLGIAGNIRFLDWQSDLSDFYKAVDVLLFNSDFDALGRTPAEAAAYGVPVVASVVRGGLRELFREGDGAVLLSEHDIEALASAVLALLENGDLRQANGTAVRERVAAYGDIARHVMRIEQLLGV